MSLIVAIRGDGSHAKRLKNILLEKDKAIKFINLSRNIKSWPELKDVYNVAGVIITSPNDTHLEYVQASSRVFSDSLIYCEKPFINNTFSLSKARKLVVSEKLLLGLNLRNSEIEDILALWRDKHNLGEQIHFCVCVSYPFGLRDSYAKSWKSSKLASPTGVLENLAIHYIDFFNQLHGHNNILAIQSNYKQEVPRTVDIIGTGANGISCNIHCSYAEGYCNTIKANFENGCIVFSVEKVELFSPTLNIDANTGLSIMPPMIDSLEIGLEQIFEKSLYTSMSLFYDCIKDQEYAFTKLEEQRIQNMSYLDAIENILG